MGCYLPDPNPPESPKECRCCNALVGRNEASGWWLERRNWQGPDDYVLFCLDCCVEKMNEWPNHPNVATTEEARKVLTGKA